MKLSEKGWDKVLDEALYFDEDIANEALEWNNMKQEYKLRHMEFQPDDFEGMVVLTVEEAHEIFAIIEDCVSLYVIRMYKDLLDDFQKRIEQAEGKK